MDEIDVPQGTTSTRRFPCSITRLVYNPLHLRQNGEPQCTVPGTCGLDGLFRWPLSAQLFF
jgi:hypothetical protein